jgi:hypothetical protein
MNINKPLFSIIVATALSSLAPQVIAHPHYDHDYDHYHHKCTPKITSSTIRIENQEAFWNVSGDCLENVTKVSLAKDEGAGFEDLPFTVMAPASPDAKTSLSISVVPRSAGIGGGFFVGEHVLSVGQYLLQVKSCRSAGKWEKCKIDDETYIPAVGDQETIDTLIALDTRLVTSIENDPTFLAGLKARMIALLFGTSHP